MSCEVLFSHDVVMCVCHGEVILRHPDSLNIRVNSLSRIKV